LGDQGTARRNEDQRYPLLNRPVLRAEQPALSENISWSSNVVFQQTLARANAANLSMDLLRKLPDIDTIDDLRRYESRQLHTSQGNAEPSGEKSKL